MIGVLVVWCVEIVGFSFSEGLRILTRKPGDREETGFWRNCLPVHDVMRSFFEGFATISSLSITSCTVFLGGHNSIAANGGGNTEALSNSWRNTKAASRKNPTYLVYDVNFSRSLDNLTPSVEQ